AAAGALLMVAAGVVFLVTRKRKKKTIGIGSGRPYRRRRAGGTVARRAIAGAAGGTGCSTGSHRSGIPAVAEDAQDQHQENRSIEQAAEGKHQERFVGGGARAARMDYGSGISEPIMSLSSRP